MQRTQDRSLCKSIRINVLQPGPFLAGLDHTRQAESPEARRALESLCRDYWFPLYAYLRRRGYTKDQAEDHTQAFFAHLLEEHSLERVRPGEHRFRSFLLASLKNFVTDDWRRTQAQKRGGGRRAVSLAVEGAEQHYCLEPGEDLSPERLFQRSWALTVIRRSLETLRREYTEAGKTELFQHLKGRITPGQEADPYREAAAALGMSENAVRVAVHRMRMRLRELIRMEVAETVASPGQVEDEIGTLFAALG
jgi:RNA polymerase sigma factor (sigma-70 family)